MTLSEQIDGWVSRCDGVESARLCVEEIVAQVLDCPRLRLPERWGEGLAADRSGQVDAMVDRLVAGEPLQYLLGTVNFYGYEIAVDPRVLIPRPETEELVSAVLALPILDGEDPVEVVDVGTGSGCIAIALAGERSQIRVTAIDVSEDALAVATANIARHGLGDRVTVTPANVLTGIEERSADLVVSNPPYVSTREFAGLDALVRAHEPKRALVAGRNGLDVYRVLVPQARAVLRAGGWIALEIGEDQRDPVETLLKNEGFRDIVCKSDLQGRNRLVLARCP